LKALVTGRAPAPQPARPTADWNSPARAIRVTPPPSLGNPAVGRELNRLDASRRSRALACLLAAALLALLCAAAAALAVDEGEYGESGLYQEQGPGGTGAPARPAGRAEWLPACAPRVMIAAVMQQNHRVHVIGYVRREMVGRRLRLQSGLLGAASVRVFKPQASGYFDIATKLPPRRSAKRAAWRIAFGRRHTPWVKLRRPLVLANAHQRRSLLVVSGQLNVRSAPGTVIDVQRLDDCRHATLVGQLGVPAGGRGPIGGSLQLRDIRKPVSTLVRLRMRTRDRASGAWRPGYWSLGLPVVLRP
jgi:hypothetical protein